MTDELAQARDKEHNDRQQRAQEVASALSTLMLGETLRISDRGTVLSVPGGWLFTQVHKAGITSSFVPQPTALPPRIKPEPGIILPK